MFLLANAHTETYTSEACARIGQNLHGFSFKIYLTIGLKTIGNHSIIIIQMFFLTLYILIRSKAFENCRQLKCNDKLIDLSH